MPLKVEIAKFLDERLDGFEAPDDLKAEFELLRTATVDGVITTNYDRLLSEAFPTYKVYVGQEGLLFSDTQGIAEIYAIHGSTSDPSSLLLTAEDYSVYDERNAYLAAKLLTIFVEHPVIFLGYSFNDQNIHQILLSLVKGLQDKAVEKLQNRLIFVEWEEGATPSVEKTQMSVEGWLLPVTRIVVPDWIAVFTALGERQHALPARTLRILKQQVYDIVLTNDPKERLYAYRDIDDDTAKDISIVFGVGAKVATVGIVGLSRPNIWDDILQNPDGGYPADEVLDRLIAKAPLGHYVPVYKYLRELGLLDEDAQVPADCEVAAGVRKRVTKNRGTLTHQIKGVGKTSMRELAEKQDWAWILNNALHLPAHTDDHEGLRDFLIANVDKTRVNSWWPTQYSKAIVAYDFLRFGLAR
jgi:hypothetical protein